MAISNWIELLVGAVILITGIFLYIHFRRKFRDMDGFEGITTEGLEGGYREEEPDMETELKQLEEQLKELAKC